MKELNLNELEIVKGGDGVVDGLCGGLMVGEGLVGLAAVASHYGWIAAIPGVGQAVAIVGAATLITCGVAAIVD